jgi:hypothetical protein
LAGQADAHGLGGLVDLGEIHRHACGRHGDGQLQDTVDEGGGSGRFDVCLVGGPTSRQFRRRVGPCGGSCPRRTSAPGR